MDVCTNMFFFKGGLEGLAKVFDPRLSAQVTPGCPQGCLALIFLFGLICFVPDLLSAREPLCLLRCLQLRFVDLRRDSKRRTPNSLRVVMCNSEGILRPQNL